MRGGTGGGGVEGLKGWGLGEVGQEMGGEEGVGGLKG